MTRKHGFTLIEMLVSVSIIASLMALLLPQLGHAREKSRRVKCLSNLRAINQAIWQYSFANAGSSPYVETPMTNGGSVPGFGQPKTVDAKLDPYNRSLWPKSLPQGILADYLSDQEPIFVCPSALTGWPREGGAYRFTYRDAGANQIAGLVSPAGSYYRENFGFLDGRQLNDLPTRFTGNAIEDSQIYARSRSTYLRDIVIRQGSTLVGPHDGGINVLGRNFEVEWRNQKAVQEDLGAGPGGSGVLF